MERFCVVSSVLVHGTIGPPVEMLWEGVDEIKTFG